MKVFRHKGGGAGPQAFTSNNKAGYKTVKNNDGKHLRSIFQAERISLTSNMVDERYEN